jgi:hypothetical protein
MGGGKGLLKLCRRYGFRDMGVFVDWCSMFQMDPDSFDKGPEAYKASRSAEETASFVTALTETMDLWCVPTGIEPEVWRAPETLAQRMRSRFASL